MDYNESWPNGQENNNNFSSNKNAFLYKYRASVPEPAKNPLNAGDPATKRFLFITGKPIRIYEHNLFKYNTTSDYTCMCLKANGLRNECPICSASEGKNFASCNGFFCVIDMGQVESFIHEGKRRIRLHHDYKIDDAGKKTTYSFQKRLLAARLGSDKNPGMLKTLQYESQQYCEGNLQYTVWDAKRSKRVVERIGDVYTFVRKLDGPQQAQEYLIRCGADPEKLDLSLPNWMGNDKEPGIFYIDPVSYYNKLCKIVGWNTGEEKPTQSSYATGADWGDSSNSGQPDNGDLIDDDIPF